MTRRVVVATANAGKVRELAGCLAPLGLELVPQDALGVASAPETGVTFIENALGKARHAASETGLPAIADDSGLVVPALGGAPGVYSARYAGAGATDAANNAKLLRTLRASLGDADRSAWFHCALVHLNGPDDAAPTLATARWGGVIVDDAAGDNGFGYDPHFLVPALGKTAAELSFAEKGALSHRGQACRRLVYLLIGSQAAPVSNAP